MAARTPPDPCSADAPCRLRELGADSVCSAGELAGAADCDGRIVGDDPGVAAPHRDIEHRSGGCRAFAHDATAYDDHVVGVVPLVRK